MSRWDQLFQEVSRIDQLRHDKIERERVELAQLQEHARWSERIARELIEQLHTRGIARAKEFEEHTGKHIEVSDPFFTGAGDERHGHGLALLAMKLENSELQVYIYRAPGSAPHLHYLPLPAMQPNEIRGGRHSRVIAIPGAIVDRNPDDGYTLHRIPIAGEEESVLTIDDLVFRAFELLVAGLRRQSTH